MNVKSNLSGAQGSTSLPPQTTQQGKAQAQDSSTARIDLHEGATIEDLIQELQRSGANARDVISILQALKAAGAIEADLEVL